MLRQGKPYSFIDHSVNREWTLHPFAFRLKPQAEGGLGPAGINIDWEHVGYDWFDPLAVSDDESFGGVPRLTESLRRCWFERDLEPHVATHLRTALKDMQTDHTSGARELAEKALGYFGEIVAASPPPQAPEQWWEGIRMVAWHLWKNGRESMGAATLNVMLSALGIIEKRLASATLREEHIQETEWRQFLSEVAKSLRQYAEARHQDIDATYSAFEQALRDIAAGRDSAKQITILTISFSSTISTCLIAAAKDFDASFDIRILESRPLFEGVSFASKVVDVLREYRQPSSKHVKVTVYSDASAAVAGKDVDIVLLGADIINDSGAVSNKTGSLPTVLSAKHASPAAKVIVIADKEKLYPFTALSHPEENDPEELIRTWLSDDKIKEAAKSINDAMSRDHGGAGDGGCSVYVKNVYFECVPPEFVDEYLLDDVARKAEDIADLAHKRKEEFAKFFKSL